MCGKDFIGSWKLRIQDWWLIMNFFQVCAPRKFLAFKVAWEVASRYFLPLFAVRGK